jgi:Cu-processing system permease protein
MIFDGLVLTVLYAFGEYPIEKVAIYMTFLNPIDLVRIMTLLHTDAAALMGYTGAVFEKFFNEYTGTIIGIGTLLIWAIIPVLMTIRKFDRKSF